MVTLCSCGTLARSFQRLRASKISLHLQIIDEMILTTAFYAAEFFLARKEEYGESKKK